jgi:hypothetical protein
VPVFSNAVILLALMRILSEKTGTGNRARVDGGGGIDPLKLDCAGLTLDLTKISNSRIRDIEIIDTLIFFDTIFKICQLRWLRFCNF